MISKRIESEEFVKNSIVPWLNAHDWKVVKLAGLKDKGPDIICQKRDYGRRYIIETKKGSEKGYIRETNFIHTLGQLPTRMRISGTTIYKYGLGFTADVAKIALRRIPWQFAKNNHLYILSVNNKGKVTEYSWRDIKKETKSK
jgi:hypothetical protein